MANLDYRRDTDRLDGRLDGRRQHRAENERARRFIRRAGTYSCGLPDDLVAKAASSLRRLTCGGLRTYERISGGSRLFGCGAVALGAVARIRQFLGHQRMRIRRGRSGTAIGPRQNLEEMAVRVLEINPATIVPVVDLVWSDADPPNSADVDPRCEQKSGRIPARQGAAGRGPRSKTTRRRSGREPRRSYG